MAFAHAVLTGDLERDRAEMNRVAVANAMVAGFELVRFEYGFEPGSDLVDAITKAIVAALTRVGKAVAKAFLDDPPAFLENAPQTVTDAVQEIVGETIDKMVSEDAATLVGQVIADEADAIAYDVSFNTPNVRALSYLENQGGELIRGLGEDARAAVRKAVRDGVRLGLPYRETAKTIENVVGLSPRDASSLLKRRASLKAAGLAQGRIEAELQRQTERLIKRRARLIARTETIRANTAGRQELWRSAVENGRLDPRSLRQWVTGTIGVCPFCQDMAGRTAPLGMPYQSPDGRALMGPPAHPACRCGEALVIARG